MKTAAPLLNRKCACGKSATAGKKCPECEKKLQFKLDRHAAPPLPAVPSDIEVDTSTEKSSSHNFAQIPVLPKNADLSYELADAPDATSPILRAQRWLAKYKADIVAAESEFQVDRRAIAGAIAWEAIENNKAPTNFFATLGIGRSVGPGKVHIRREWRNLLTGGGEDTAAQQAESRGYLDEKSFSDRKASLKTPQGAIRYIAAIMKGIAEIAKPIQDIRFRPDLLTDVYQSRDLDQWELHIRSLKPGHLFTVGNSMGKWVRANIEILEQAVGKPALLFDPMTFEEKIQHHSGANK